MVVHKSQCNKIHKLTCLKELESNVGASYKNSHSCKNNEGRSQSYIEYSDFFAEVGTIDEVTLISLSGGKVKKIAAQEGQRVVKEHVCVI